MFLILLSALYSFSLLPFPLATGLFSFAFTLDTCNIAFVLLVFVLSPLILLIASFEASGALFFTLSSLLVCGLFATFLVASLFMFFVLYEVLIIILFFILLLFVPSFYRIRTAFFFFLFTVIGSIVFIYSVILLESSNS